jgi:hypothetical protein
LMSHPRREVLQRFECLRRPNELSDQAW